MVFFVALCTGCASNYKHVLISVVDKQTGKPIPGVRVTTSYGKSPFSRASTSPFTALTDEAGRAVIVGNFFEHEPLIFWHSTYSFGPWINLSVNNEHYHLLTGSSASGDQNIELSMRSPSFIPTVPDIIERIDSNEELARQAERNRKKVQLMNDAAEEMILTHPEYWPEHKSEKSPWPKDTAAWTYLGKRWKHGSETSMGSEADLKAIKEAVLHHMKHLGAKADKVRWLSPTLVMVESFWQDTPLAGASYYYVVEKTDNRWMVKTFYMTTIS